MTLLQQSRVGNFKFVRLVRVVLVRLESVMLVLVPLVLVDLNY